MFHPQWLIQTRFSSWFPLLLLWSSFSCTGARLAEHSDSVNVLNLALANQAGEDGHLNSNRWMLSYEPKDSYLERITCDSTTNSFETWIAIDFKGELRTDSFDFYDLGDLLMNAFRAETAWNCDPLQRVVQDITSIVIQSVVQLPMSTTTNDWTVYKVSVLAYGDGLSLEHPTALEPDPPEFSTFVKTPVGDQCSLSDILEERPSEHHYASDCPFLGCYCPNNLLPSSTPTSGATEAQLASTLDAAVEHCQDEGIAVHTGSGGKKSSGKGKGSSGSKRRDCLPGVEQVTTVAELQEILPCGPDIDIPADYVTFIDADPCEMGKAKITEFFDELIKEYNMAQFEVCDTSFRRLEKIHFDFEARCGGYSDMEDDYYSDYSGGHRRRRLDSDDEDLPWGGDFSAKDDTGDEEDDDFRRDLVERIVHEISLNETSPDSMVRRRGSEMGPYYYEPPPMESKCFCSAFSKPGPGITEEEFEALANKAMQRVTNGQVQVTDQFEVTVGCPDSERISFRSGAAAFLNVDVSILTPQDIAELEEDCVLTYNSYGIEFCTPSFTRLQSCRISPIFLESPDYDDGDYRRGGRRLESVNNGLFVELVGLTSLIDGKQEPVINDSKGYHRALGSSSDTSSIAQHVLKQVMDRRQLKVVSHDQCFCRADIVSGHNPTTDLFASFLNLTGIVDFVLPADPKECEGPRVFSQSVYAIANGDLNSISVRHELEQFLQDTLNTLSVQKCVESHFYAFSTDMVWWERKPASGGYEKAFAVKFEVKFVSFNNVPNQDVLYKVTKKYTDYARPRHEYNQRALDYIPDGSGAGDLFQDIESENSEWKPQVTEVFELSERQLQQLAEESTCFCMPGARETPVLNLSVLNKQVDYEICEKNAVPGVSFFLIVH